MTVCSCVNAASCGSVAARRACKLENAARAIRDDEEDQPTDDEVRSARRGPPHEEGGDAHIEASWIFTSNAGKLNLLVIVAALLVWWPASSGPDLIVGGVSFLIVANGARRFGGLARTPSSDCSACGRLYT